MNGVQVCLETSLLPSNLQFQVVCVHVVSLLIFAVFGALFSHLLDVCSVTYEWVSDDCGTQTAVGIEYNIRNMRGLGTWLRRDHGPEGTFEEAFVAGPEWESGANGALRIYLEDNGILGQVSGVGMVSGKNAVFDAFV